MCPEDAAGARLLWALPAPAWHAGPLYMLVNACTRVCTHACTPTHTRETLSTPWVLSFSPQMMGGRRTSAAPYIHGTQGRKKRSSHQYGVPGAGGSSSKINQPLQSVSRHVASAGLGWGEN